MIWQEQKQARGKSLSLRRATVHLVRGKKAKPKPKILLTKGIKVKMVKMRWTEHTGIYFIIFKELSR